MPLVLLAAALKTRPQSIQRLLTSLSARLRETPSRVSGTRYSGTRLACRTRRARARQRHLWWPDRSWRRMAAAVTAAHGRRPSDRYRHQPGSCVDCGAAIRDKSTRCRKCFGLSRIGVSVATSDKYAPPPPFCRMCGAATVAGRCCKPKLHPLPTLLYCALDGQRLRGHARCHLCSVLTGTAHATRDAATCPCRGSAIGASGVVQEASAHHAPPALLARAAEPPESQKGVRQPEFPQTERPLG